VFITTSITTANMQTQSYASWNVYTSILPWPTCWTI